MSGDATALQLVLSADPVLFDIVPLGVPLQEAFDKIRATALLFDQIILECDTWLHLSIAREGAMPRRQALIASGTPGRWSYLPAPAL